MSRDLEQLIESLITDISCYGDLGCTVTHILDALCGLYQKSAIQLDCCVDPVQIDTSSRLLWSTAWDWLKERKDISVGANRKWNHLPLAAILAIPDTDVQADAANPLPVVQLSSSPAPLVRVRSPVEPAQHPLRINSPRKRPRVYVSEDRMWEAIAGHAPDYRRIPRLEWMALVGIASTKEGGILQGDLGRLVGQDKRSLPKRTDALAEKGYISKRTTLVRGTKTSKMWLTHFAPALPTDPTKAAAGMLTTVDMSRDALARDLDPVPWRARWTGDSVDYISLAETIMAVVKAFGIIRYHDLRCKLGILGLRWQMKVAAKTCRFFVQAGAIQYVGATLAGKLFKDCLKFAHDLTHEDWAAYLATGKQKNSAVLPSGCADLGVHASHSFTSSASIDNATSLGLAADPSCHTNRERLSAQLFWVVDKPLILTVFDKIAAASDLGLSNKQIGGSTLGSSFRRYLSSISSTLAIPTLQPEHLSHFRVGSEMHRKGKSQQYRYFARHLNKCVDFTVPSAEGIVTTRPWQGGDVARQLRVSQCELFPALTSHPATILTGEDIILLAHDLGKGSRTGTLKRKVETSYLSQPGEVTDVGLQRHAKRVRLSRNEQQDCSNSALAPTSGISTRLKLTRMAARRAASTQQTDEAECGSLFVTLRVRPGVLAAVVGGCSTNTAETAINAAIDGNCVDDRTPNSLASQNAESERRGGRRQKKGNQNRERPSVVCDKCGGTWKNDVGLKYHLEKSRTSCNPNYVASVPGHFGIIESSLGTSAATKHSATMRRQTRPLRANLADGNITNPPNKGGEGNSVADTIETKGAADGGSVNISKGRNRRKHWSQRSETRDAVMRSSNRANGQCPPQKASCLRPPMVCGGVSVGGLINDPFGSVRDMPSEHAIVQSVLQRPRLDESPRQLCLDRREQSLTGKSGFAQLSAIADRRSLSDYANQTPAQHTSIESGISSSKVAGIAPTEGEAVRTMLGSNVRPQGDVTDLLGRLLLHVVRANDGVFPGGRSAWYAVLATWELAFPAETFPPHEGYQNAFASLVKSKQIVCSTHVFKDARGLLANYELLRIPGVDASCPAVATTKAKIISAHPKLYTPAAFTPKNKPSNEVIEMTQPVFSSRRKIVQGIEVLDAPFYTNKAANERPPTSPEGNSVTPRKRKRRLVTRAQESRAEHGSTDTTRRKDIFRLFMDGGDEGGVPSLARSRKSGDDQSVTRLVFLSPNTHLGLDVLADTKQDMLPDHPPPEPTYPIHATTDSMKGDCSVTFTPVEVVFGKDGAWPVAQDLFSRQNDSLTIRGWMPDSRWFLRQNLPQSLAEMIKWRGQPRTTFPRSDQYLEFCEQADACFDWELSGEGIKLMLAESIAPEYIFIDLGVDDLPGEWDSPPLEWSPTNQLSPVEWLSLRTSDPSIAADHLWSGDPSRQRRKKQRQKHIRNNEKDVVVSLDLKTRSLITLPKDADFKDGARRANGLDETNETLLIAAFVATRTLLGGADRIIEWGLMMTLFPNMALSAMRRFWSKARKDRKSFIDQLTERFQVRFVASYEREEFPAIDFDNYVNYDWSRVIKWTASLIEDSFELPVSKSALGQGYSLTAAWADVDHWREDYYNFQMSVFNRFEAATSRPATKDLDQRRKVVSNPTADDITTAMSWLRSLCYTPRDKYAPQDIRLKMSSLGGGDENRIHGLLEQAVETLQGQGVITDSKLKALEGRPYRLTETFLPRFVKWTHESKFIDAARFKSKLDGSFRRGEKIRIPYVLKDGEVMAMMNLQASGRIAVVAVDVPHIPLGFDPGNYESRKYPKSYYNFGLEIAPTKDYVYDEDLDILQQASSNSPPKENHNRAIPLWSDFFGALNKERWSQVLGAIAFIVSTRGPLDAASVCAVLKPYLQEFEIRLAFDWGRRNGVLKEMRHDSSCTVDEWWWLLVGRQRDIVG